MLTSTPSGMGPERVDLTTDGGATWTDTTPPLLAHATETRQIEALFALDARHAWLTYGPIGSGTAQSVLATADGGATWRQLGTAPRPGCRLQFVDARDGWCVDIGAALGSEGVDLFRTRDGGRSWHEVSRTTPQSTPPGALPFGCDKQIAFSTERLGWAAFTCAGGVPPLYRTSDGGTDWARVPIAPPPNARLDGGSGFPAPPVTSGRTLAVAYAADAGPGPRLAVFSSRDGGATWSQSRLPQASRRWTVDLATPTRWYLLAGARLLVTDDSGAGWHAQAMDRRFGPVRAFDFVTAGTGWIGTLDATLWRTTDRGRHWARLTPP